MLRDRILAALIALCVLMPVNLAAHVTLEQREAPVGATYKAVFKVGHGCGSSPTVKLTVHIPEGVIAVKPMPKPGWTIETETGKYEKAYRFLHGAPLSEGVTQIVWKGKLDDKFYDEFVVSAFFAEELPAGYTLYFPVIQECEAGVHRWVDVPAADGSALKEPAPAVRLLPKRGHQH